MSNFWGAYHPIWDSVLFEAVREQERLESLLNCSVNDVEMASDNRIKAVYGWQLVGKHI